MNSKLLILIYMLLGELTCWITTLLSSQRGSSQTINGVIRQQIYCWKVGSDEEDIVRLTFDTDSDSQPDLYLFEPVSIKNASVSPKDHFSITTINVNFIKYSLVKDSKVRINVYSLSGKLVSTLTNTQQKAGTYTLTYDTNDSYNSTCSNGIYIVRISINGMHLCKQAILLKQLKAKESLN